VQEKGAFCRGRMGGGGDNAHANGYNGTHGHEEAIAFRLACLVVGARRVRGGDGY